MGATKISPKGPVPTRLIPLGRGVHHGRFPSIGPATEPPSRFSPHLAEALLSALADPRLADVCHQAERMARSVMKT